MGSIEYNIRKHLYLKDNINYFCIDYFIFFYHIGFLVMQFIHQDTDIQAGI